MSKNEGVNREACSDGTTRNLLLQDIGKHYLDRHGMVLVSMGFSPEEVATYQDRVRTDIAKAEFNGQLMGRLDMKEITPPEHAAARQFMHTALLELLTSKGFSNDKFDAAHDKLDKKIANQ